MHVRPKVAIVSHAYPCFVGDYRANFIEALALAYSAYADVTVFTPYVTTWRRDTESPGVPSSVRIVCYRYLPFRRWHVLGREALMQADLSLAWLRACTAPVMMLAGIMVVAKHLRQTPYDMIHAHWALPNTLITLAARGLARAQHTKVFTSFPGSDVTVLKALGRLGRWCGGVIARSDFLSCNSQDLKEELIALGLPADKIALVIYGVDAARLAYDATARQQIRAQYHVSETESILLMVGRFVPKKGFAMVMEAMPQIRAATDGTATVWVVGDGPEAATYQRILAANGCIPYVRFLGRLPVHELHRLYSAVDILLMPSMRLPADGLNVVVPEAMACGRPIVATRVGGNDLVVLEGENGFLHEPGDLATLAERTALLCRDTALRARMGQASRRLIDERFSWQRIAAQLLREVAQQKGEQWPI